MVRPIRRIIAGNDDNGKAVVLADGPSIDVVLDPARPGFGSTRLWVSDASPARVKHVRETLHLPQSLEPPPGGTVCRFFEYPPESGYLGNISRRDVQAYFEMMGSPEAWISDPRTPHPYMQRTLSLDLTYVLEGNIVLVLDTMEVELKEGDILIQRGTAHAFSNRSDKPAILVVSQQYGERKSEGAYERIAASIQAPAEDGRVPMRRVLTGHDADGRSCVLCDSDVPNVFPRKSGSWFYEVFTIDNMPVDLSINEDGGRAGRPVSHSPPTDGANWRISLSPADPMPARALAGNQSPEERAMDTGGGTQRSQTGKHKGLHRTPSLDYAVCLAGERVLVLEDSEVVLGKGDTVIQLGNWHTWGHRERVPTIMSYVMIGGEFG